MSVEAAAIGTNGHEPSYLEYKGKHTGFLGWVLSTDHKRIGVLYLISLSFFFLVGVTFGFLMLTDQKLSRYLLIIPSIWALIGLNATFNLGVYQDIMLLISALTANIFLLKRRNSVN